MFKLVVPLAHLQQLVGQGRHGELPAPRVAVIIQGHGRDKLPLLLVQGLVLGFADRVELSVVRGRAYHRVVGHSRVWKVIQLINRYMYVNC